MVNISIPDQNQNNNNFNGSNPISSSNDKFKRKQQEYHQQPNNKGSNNNNNMNPSVKTINNKKDEEGRLAIKIEQKEFPDTVSTIFNDTIGVCQIINGLLRPIFSNYHGSKIEIVQNRQLYTSIFFLDDGKEPLPGQYKGIERIIDKNTLTNADERIAALNRFNTSGVRKYYKLTKEAKEILLDLIHPSFINRSKPDKVSVDWDKITREESFQSQYAQTQIIVRVVVDLTRIIKLIYGDTAPNGDHWAYQINIGNPINPINTPAGGVIANKWQLFIMRTSEQNVSSLAYRYGYNYGGNDMGIITQ